MSAPHRCNECGRFKRNGHSGMLTPSEFMAFLDPASLPVHEPDPPEIVAAQVVFEAAEALWRDAEQRHLEAISVRFRVNPELRDPPADRDQAEANDLVRQTAHLREVADERLTTARARYYDMQRWHSNQRIAAEYEANHLRGEDVTRPDPVAVSTRIGRLRQRPRRTD